MTFTSRGIKAGIDKLKISVGRDNTKRDYISMAVARLNLEPDLAVKAVNEIFAAEDRYAKAVELLGVMRANKIRNSL